MMKNSLKLILVFTVVLLLSCQQKKVEITPQQISEIQHKYIADKRLEFFDVWVNISGGDAAMEGYTVSEPAFAALQEKAKENNVGFRVELLPGEAFRENPWGIVTLSVCNIRARSRHSAELVTQALLGTPVKIFKEQNGWYLIQTPDRYFGWVDAAGIAPKTNVQMATWKAMPKQIYSRVSGMAFSEPDNNAQVESDLVLGDLLSIEGDQGNFFEILFADGRKAFVRKSDCISTDAWLNKTLAISDLLKTAFQFKGRPYLWGGTSPKMFDCSGFTKTVYYYYGLILQRDASQQTLYGKEVDTSDGYEKLEPGDLLFFGRKASAENPERVTHVGLYIGNLRFIHASGKVRINSLDPASKDYTQHYEKAFVRARRILGNADGKGIEWIANNEYYKQVLPQ